MRPPGKSASSTKRPPFACLIERSFPTLSTTANTMPKFHDAGRGIFPGFTFGLRISGFADEARASLLIPLARQTKLTAGE
jgi:hypothetical protein